MFTLEEITRASSTLPFHIGYGSKTEFRRIGFPDKILDLTPLAFVRLAPTNLSPVSGNHFERNDTFSEGLSTFSAKSHETDMGSGPSTHTCPPAWGPDVREYPLKPAFFLRTSVEHSKPFSSCRRRGPSLSPPPCPQTFMVATC